MVIQIFDILLRKQLFPNDNSFNCFTAFLLTTSKEFLLAIKTLLLLFCGSPAQWLLGEARVGAGAGVVSQTNTGSITYIKELKLMNYVT